MVQRRTRVEEGMVEHRMKWVVERMVLEAKKRVDEEWTLNILYLRILKRIRRRKRVNEGKMGESEVVVCEKHDE